VEPGTLSGLEAAIALHTRIPVRARAEDDHELTRAIPWFPVVGAGVGALVAAVYVCLAAALPSFLAAAVATGAGAMLTGALHEDGLADVADAFAGGATRARRLAIMQDPRLGTFGVIAVVVSLLIRVGSFAALDAWSAVALIPATHALSRVGVIVLMRWLPPAHPGGLSARYAVSLTTRDAAAGIAIGVVAAIALMGPWAVAAIALCALATYSMGALARAKIGGMTGDVLGATQQISELAILLLGAAAMHEGWGPLAWWRA
jgi:adenosylcobinamide-GDP ribazoletransferase